MEAFAVNREFNSYADLCTAKKSYEDASKSILVIGSSLKVKGEEGFVNTMVYQRIIFHCKAGKERQIKSKGLRKSSTYKKNCEV